MHSIGGYYLSVRKLLTPVVSALNCACSFTYLISEIVMNAVAQVIQFPSQIDRLGELKAIMADLQAEYDQIADSLRAQGAGTHEGRMFKAVVSEEALTTTFDAAAAKAKLLEVGVAQSWIDGNIKVSVRKASVTVRAR